MSDRKILLVDDDMDGYLLVKGMLADRGVSLTWASGFDQAVMSLDAEDWDVVLVDYRLGARSGMDVVAYGRRRHPNLPMVMLTGFDGSDVDEAASQAGAAGFLSKKELSPSLLDRTIRYAIPRPSEAPSTKRRPHDLTLQASLARGLSIREAARLSGVSERTVYRRLASTEFRSEVAALENEIRQRMVDRTVDSLFPEA
jgi:DNA-binding NtrC family response regulator